MWSQGKSTLACNHFGLWGFVILVACLWISFNTVPLSDRDAAWRGERNADSMKGQTSAMNQLIYFHSAGGRSTGICFGFDWIRFGFLHKQFGKNFLLPVIRVYKVITGWSQHASKVKAFHLYIYISSSTLQTSLSHALPAAYFVFKLSLDLKLDVESDLIKWKLVSELGLKNWAPKFFLIVSWVPSYIF